MNAEHLQSIPNMDSQSSSHSEYEAKTETTTHDSVLNAGKIWQVFHWSFFTNVQALIICLNRFKQHFSAAEYADAEQELLCAAALLRAAGASMQLAASFNKEHYENSVRLSMMPPFVQSDNFSGLMSWEHAALMTIWRQLRPVFQDLPKGLEDAHKTFVEAYHEMAVGHTHVCEKFGGADESSLRAGERSGVESLKRFAINRSRLIDPSKKAGGCPFDIND